LAEKPGHVNLVHRDAVAIESREAGQIAGNWRRLAGAAGSVGVGRSRIGQIESLEYYGGEE
jgi:hypothetical protein